MDFVMCGGRFDVLSWSLFSEGRFALAAGSVGICVCILNTSTKVTPFPGQPTSIDE